MPFLVIVLGVAIILRSNAIAGHMLQSENIFENIEALTIDLMYKTRGHHCYTLVTDKMYQSILTANLFRAVGQSTYFIVLVPDFMDTLKPEPIFLHSLMQAQRSGCQTFLIYLANGIQMERFLRFVDELVQKFVNLPEHVTINAFRRFRILDTRSKFVLLHDYRLFSRRLHYLWRRIVNVIFVKENDNSRRGNLSTGTWFELTTVPFPLPIKEVYVDKKLDSWRSGRYQRGAKLFQNKLDNLNNGKLKAVVFKHTPGVSGGSDNPSGVEVEILNTIADAMNFSLLFYESNDSDSAKWGRLESNGSASGLLGEMINRQADFGIADLHYTPHHLNIMDLSIPYTSQCLTFLTPESLTDNSWKTLILPFSGGMWLGVLFFLFSVGFVFYILGQIHIRLRRKEVMVKRKKYVRTTKRIKRTSTTSETISIQIKILPKRTRRMVTNKDIFESFGNCILYTYSMLLVVSLPRFPKSWSIRVLTGWYWIYCILVVTPTKKIETNEVEDFRNINLVKMDHILILERWDGGVVDQGKRRKETRYVSIMTAPLWHLSECNSMAVVTDVDTADKLAVREKINCLNVCTQCTSETIIVFVFNLIQVAYRASLTAILAKSAPRVTIDTLRQLAESPLGCGAWGEQNKQFFVESLDETGQKIGAKLEDVDDMMEAIERVARGKYAYYENEYTLREVRSKRDTQLDPHPLHIMKECAINMPISIGLEKNSAIKPRFDKLLRRLIEAGLVSKWLSEAVRNYEQSEEAAAEGLMDLKKMYGAFVALGIGYLISIVALLGEIIYWKCVVVKSPLYDEYALYKLYEK